MNVIDLKNCIIRIKDGGSNAIDVTIGVGNLRWSEKVNRNYIKDRGKLSTVQNGDEEPMDLSIDCQFHHVTAATGDTDATVPEALKQIGKASGWESSSSDPCEPYAVDVVVFNQPPCDDDGETTTFPDFRYEQLAFDIKAGTLVVTGKCNAKEPTSTRGSITS